MPANPNPILDLLFAYRRSKTLFAAVELGVFEALDPAGQDSTGQGPSKSATVGELAAKLQCNEASLRRMLDACVGMDLLQRDGEQYSNTAATNEYLCQSSPRRLTGYLRFSNEVSWKLWTHLEDAVREGTHRWKQAYGWDGPIFSHFFRTEESKREFLMGMHGFGVISSPEVVRAFDLKRFHTLADLGGATGHLVIAACEAYSHLRGIVFDLPEVVPLAKEIVGYSAAKARIDVVGGDFFRDPLPQADLYSLGRILHDWDEAKIQRLLQRIYAALPEGGGLLVAEKMVADDRAGPDWAQMQDLNMLACTEGRERTLAEYVDVLQAAGFKEVRGHVTQVPVDAILAIK